MGDFVVDAKVSKKDLKRVEPKGTAQAALTVGSKAASMAVEMDGMMV
jgi:hypothetical protein